MFKQPRVRAAVEFAAAAHAGQKRKTGEPYVSHCIETALIVEANLPHWRHDSRCVFACRKGTGIAAGMAEARLWCAVGAGHVHNVLLHAAVAQESSAAH
jgi:hypothetical protein